MKERKEHKEFIKSTLKAGGLETAPNNMYDNILNGIQVSNQLEDQLFKHINKHKTALIDTAPAGFEEQILLQLPDSLNKEKYMLNVRINTFWVWICALLLMVTGILSYAEMISQGMFSNSSVQGLMKFVPQASEQMYNYGLWMVVISLIWWILDSVISGSYTFAFKPAIPR